MATLIITPQAERDLEEIWLCTASANFEAAERLGEQINAQMLRLSEMPFLGRSRKELRNDLRSSLVLPYVIFYRVIDDGVEIIRIIHGARDIPRAFNE